VNSPAPFRIFKGDGSKSKIPITIINPPVRMIIVSFDTSMKCYDFFFIYFIGTNVLRLKNDSIIFASNVKNSGKGRIS